MLRYDQIDDHLEPHMTWPVAEAKARFSELLDAAINEGPQIVSRRGVETAVLLPISEWDRLRKANSKPLIDPISDPNGPHDFEIPRLGNFKLRAAPLKD